jgi:hypothetical protein
MLENIAVTWYLSTIYVYERNTTSGTWAETAKLFGAGQGNPVAISGNVIVAGDYKDDLGEGWYTGSAYVFERDSSGSWAQKMKLAASDGKPGDYFGRSVAISGGTIVVGSNGAIYIFKKNETTGLWGETVKLSDSTFVGSYLFGWSVSISDNAIAVGSPHDSENGYQKGSVFILD